MRSENGSTLLSVLLSLVILSITVSSIGPIVQAQARQAAHANARITASIVRMNLFSHFLNSTAWAAMVNDSACNPDLACVKNGAACPGAWDAARTVNCIYDSSGQKIFDATVATNGFSQSARACDFYSAINPNSQCILRPSVTWRCQQAPCAGTSPMAISVRLRHDNSNTVSLNMAQYAFEVLK